MPEERLLAQARDELFSHINRCGVLRATREDQSSWMDETIDYIGERYPDLSAADLQGLHAVGMRFCQPAINNMPAAPEPTVEETTDELEASADEDGETEAVVAVAAQEGEEPATIA